MKPRVLFLNDTFNTPGGAEQQVLYLAKGLEQNHIDAKVACIPGSMFESHLDSAHIAKIPLRRLRTNPLIAAREIRKMCQRSGVNIIHTSSFLTNIAGRLAGGLPGVKVVSTYHCEPDSYKASSPGLVGGLIFSIRRLVEKVMWNRSDEFIAVSKAVAAKLKAQGVPPDRLTVVPNGIDAAAVLRQAKEATGGRSVKNGQGRINIGAMARLDPVKGLDVMVEAVRVLVGRGLPVRATIIGDGPERERLERLTKESGLDGRIDFTGYMENPYPVMASFDLYVVSSRSEGQNITILDAMALGLPVVATEVGGIVDMIDDGATGILVPPDKPQLLADAIERLSKDEQLRERVVGAATAVLENFDVGLMEKRTLEVYQRALQNLSAS